MLEINDLKDLTLLNWLPKMIAGLYDYIRECYDDGDVTIVTYMWVRIYENENGVLDTYAGRYCILDFVSFLSM